MTNRVLRYSHSEPRWLEARRGQLVKKFDGTYDGRKNETYDVYKQIIGE